MTSTPPTPGAAPAPSARSRWASLLPVGIALLGILELAILILIGVRTSLWWSILIVVVGWIIGAALVVAAGQQSFSRLRSLMRAVRGVGSVQDHLSRPAFTLLAALCFFFPGILTDLAGLVLLLTPVQKKAVTSMGLGSGSQAANRVLYRRSEGRVIDGEIVIGPASGPGSSTGTGEGGERPQPPVITQD